MIDERRAWQKLEDLAATFNNHIRAKRYHQAKHCYDTARNVSVFLEMEEKESQILFGSRKAKGEIEKEGMFKEELVQKAYFETCVAGKAQPENCFLCERLFGQKKRA